jgi:hypothetical protein
MRLRMKISLSGTSIGMTSNITDYAKNARKFLIENVDAISFDHDEELRLLKTHDNLVKTVVSELYQQALVEEKLEMFTLLTLDQVTKIPSWFLISWLDIDTLELHNSDKNSYDILSSITKYRDKVLMNITPYYSRNRNAIVDVSEFYSRIVRNMLNRSYRLSGKLWLTPTLVYLLTKLYSIILSTKIGKLYNLTHQEQYVIATVLSVYFTNNCSDIEDTINPIMFKMDFLQRVVNTKVIYEHIEEKYTVDTFDLKATIDTIVALSPTRMNKFTLSTFLSMNSSLSSNQMMSLIALEYPPYWCYLVLSALSGEKTNIYHTIKTLNLRKESMEFQNEILKTSSFIRSLG